MMDLSDDIGCLPTWDTMRLYWATCLRSWADEGLTVRLGRGGFFGEQWWF